MKWKARDLQGLKKTLQENNFPQGFKNLVGINEMKKEETYKV